MAGCAGWGGGGAASAGTGASGGGRVAKRGEGEPTQLKEGGVGYRTDAQTAQSGRPAGYGAFLRTFCSNHGHGYPLFLPA